MMNVRHVWFVLIIAVVFALAPMALAAGGQHAAGPITGTHPDWPDGILTVVNSNGRVYGHWVNANDEFFYQGDTAALNAFLAHLGKIQLPTVLVIHSASTRRST